MNCPHCGGFALKTAFICPSCSATLRPAPVGPRVQETRTAGGTGTLTRPVEAPRQVASPPAEVPARGLPIASSVPTFAAAPRRWPRVVGVGVALVALGGLLGVCSPAGQEVVADRIVRLAADRLPYTEVAAREVAGGTGHFALPDGSTRTLDEKLGQPVYRFDQALALLDGSHPRVTFDLTGFKPGVDAACARGAAFTPGLAVAPELHRGRTYRSVEFKQPATDDVDHPHQQAAYYQLAGSAGDVVSLVFYFPRSATDPRALAAVLDHVLGSVRP